jgi:hypothetical protein
MRSNSLFDKIGKLARRNRSDFPARNKVRVPFGASGQAFRPALADYIVYVERTGVMAFRSERQIGLMLAQGAELALPTTARCQTAKERAWWWFSMEFALQRVDH